MTLELILARKAVVATVLTPKHWTGKFEFLRAGAMLDSIVTYEIRPSFAGE